MSLSTYVDGRQMAGGYQYLRCGDGFGVCAPRNTAGVTKAKRKISRATGIPLTRQGRRSKLGRWMGMK